MKEQKINALVRTCVILALLSLIALAVLFEVGVRQAWSLELSVLGIASFVVLLITFIIGYIRSGLWSFSHKAIRDLDEREIKMTGRSLQLAYGFFSIIVLIFLFVLALAEIKVSVVMAASLLLFAHLLPTAILVFSEKDLRL